MISLNLEENNIFTLDVSTPRLPEDEKQFLFFLNEIAAFQNYGIILKVQGEKSFSLEAKKHLSKWFKDNKEDLRSKCFGFARVLSDFNQGNDSLQSKALRKAFPCPYEVFENIAEARSWLKRN